MQSNLPFSSKPKLEKKKKTKVDKIKAVIREPKEREVAALLAQIYTIRKDKERKRKEKKAEKRIERSKLLQKIEHKKLEKRKEETVERYREQAKKRTKIHGDVPQKKRKHS